MPFPMLAMAFTLEFQNLTRLAPLALERGWIPKFNLNED
jgi:hypothetical protein